MDFDDQQQYYDAKYTRGAHGIGPMFPYQFRFLSRWAGCGGRVLRILDLGGGTGEYSLALQRMGHDVTLFELSAVALDHACRLGVKKIIHGRFPAQRPTQLFDLVLVRGFSPLNTDDVQAFGQMLGSIEALLVSGGIVLYWSTTDLTGRWTPSGWFYWKPATLRPLFDGVLVFPALRYQALLPVCISGAVSRLVCSLDHLPRALTLAAYRRKASAAR